MKRLVAALAASGLSLGLFAAPVTVLVSGRDGKPLMDAVVVVDVKGTRPTAAERAELGQREKSFVPSLLVVQTGTSVSFPNFDTVRHHVYSFSPTKPFELKLYAGTPAAPVVFDKPGIAVVGCNIHDRMSAWIVVVDTPYFAKTDANGHATLDVPPGDHALRLWHAGMGEAAPKNATTLHTPSATPIAVRLDTP